MWNALRRGWWVIVLVAVAGAGVGAGVGVLQGPSHSTQLQFFVTTNGSGTASDAVQGGQFAQQRVASYTALLSGAELATRVADRVGGDLTAARVASDITASTVTGTVLIDVTVVDADPAVAADIADAVSVEFPEQVEVLETTDGSDAAVTVSLSDEPSTPVASDPLVRLAAFGAVLGLLLGAVIAVSRALLDRTVREKDQVEQLTGAPVTGIVFRDGELEHRGAEGGPGRMGPRTQEQYRQLATSLQYLDVDNPPKVIMVVSSVPAEGKTTTVVHLAEALAESGARVTIVEADLRRPRVVEQLGLVAGAGLTNVLAGQASVADVVQVAAGSGVHVIGAGPTPPNPGRLLGSAQMSALLAQLREQDDYVLIDAAPLLPVADSRALGALVDGVLLTARFGKTTGDQLAEAAAALDSVGARTLGVVLTMVPQHGELAQALAYGEDYGYASPHREPETADADPVAWDVPPRPQIPGTGAVPDADDTAADDTAADDTAADDTAADDTAADDTAADDTAAPTPEGRAVPDVADVPDVPTAPVAPAGPVATRAPAAGGADQESALPADSGPGATGWPAAWSEPATVGPPARLNGSDAAGRRTSPSSPSVRPGSAAPAGPPSRRNS